MKRSTVAIATVAALCAMFFATDASAKKKKAKKKSSSSNAIEFRVSGNFSLVDFTEESVNTDEFGRPIRQILYSDDPLIGGGATLSLGYRFGGIFGIYFEQDFESMRMTGRMERINSELTDPSLIGGSYGVFKFIMPLGASEFDVGFGLGGMYSITRNRDREYVPIINSHVEPGSCFALRFTSSWTLYIAGFIGIGLHLDYNIGFNYLWTLPEEYWHGTTKYQNTINQINPGLHVSLKI